jgi:hypothetical protein
MQNRRKFASKPPDTFEGGAERVYMVRCKVGRPRRKRRSHGRYLKAP